MRHQKSTALVLILCCCPLVLLALIGTYSRPQSDDSCYLHDARSLSFSEHLEIKRGGLQGRSSRGDFTYLVVWHLLAPLGYQAAALMPALLIAFGLLSAAALLRKILAMCGRPVEVAGFTLSALLVSAAIGGFYTWQSFTWFSASVKHGIPIGLAALYGLLLLEASSSAIDKRRQAASAAAGVCLCFAAAGSTAVFFVWMLAALSLLSAVCVLMPRMRGVALPTLLSGWLGTLAAGAVVLSAQPFGNQALSASADNIAVVLPTAMTIWLERLAADGVLGAFALMLAAGLLAGLWLPVMTGASGRGTSVWPARAALAAQVALLPMLASHVSWDPVFFGRYSAGYMAIFAANVSLIVCFGALSRRGWLEQLQAGKALAVACLVIVALILALLTGRGMQWQAFVLLWLSIPCILMVGGSLLAPRLPGAMVKGFGLGIGLLYAVTWLGGFAVVLAANLTSDHNHGRIYTFIPFLIAWSGLAWGLWFGCGIKAWGGSLRIVRAAALAVVVFLCAGIVVKTWRAHAPMKDLASAFDTRHELIMNAKAAGLRDIEAPASLDLSRALRESFCTLEFYDIDSLSYTDSD